MHYQFYSHLLLEEKMHFLDQLGEIIPIKFLCVCVQLKQAIQSNFVLALALKH